MIVLLSVYVVIAILLTLLSSVTLAWMMYAWRERGSLELVRGTSPVSRPSQVGPRPSGPHSPTTRGPRGLFFTLLVPARHEDRVLAATLRGLTAMRHAAVEIVVIVGHDDAATAAVAYQCARERPDLIRVVVDHHAVKNKPRALNTALAHCRGDIVGIFDAEDVVHPDLLAAVEHRFLTDDCAVVQSGVQLMNYRSSWYAVRNVLEYWFWFHSRLHFQASRGFIPLGGNTVFVRRDVLEGLGGWDGDCLAEDCDLGVRISTVGLRVSVMYDPELVTREETPHHLSGFVKQRTRWNQGFLQVMSKGDWRSLPQRRQRLLAAFTLSTPFLQALNCLLIPISVATVLFSSLPIGITMLAFLPITPALTIAVIEHLALDEFGRTYAQPARLIDHIRLLVGTPMFHMLLSWAAARAVVRHLRGQHSWEKTAHLGLHLDLDGAALQDGIETAVAA